MPAGGWMSISARTLKKNKRQPIIHQEEGWAVIFVQKHLSYKKMTSNEERRRLAKELVNHREWIRTALRWKRYRFGNSEMDDVERKFRVLYPDENPTWMTLCEMVSCLCHEIVPEEIGLLAIDTLRWWVRSNNTEPTEELRNVMEAYFESRWLYHPGEKKEVTVMHRQIGVSALMIECIRFLTREEMKLAEDVAMRLAEEVPGD